MQGFVPEDPWSRTRVRLGFPSARPVVSDERSEEFRRSVKESLNGPFQATGSDDTEPEIGIERKNKTYLFSEPANQVYRANVIAVATPILPDGPFSAVRSIRRFR